MKFGLESMRTLMRELGDPQRHFPSALVAGTNGKGSVSAMADAILRCAGFRTARYTSPHLVHLEERFLVDGLEIETTTLANAVDKVRSAVDSLVSRHELEAPATFFECATAAAFELFASAEIDIAVLEVGLGGRLDATNVVTPLACAITTIDLDHQAQLGSTIGEIAAEKAGIIKPGVPVVVGDLPSAAQSVVEEFAAQVSAPVIRALETAAIPDDTKLALAGAHQRHNALVATALVGSLHGFPVTAAAVKRGLETVHWPGRLEYLKHGSCDVLIDAAHNPAGARMLAAHLRETGWADVAMVFGAMADKDVSGMMEALAPAASRFVVTTAPTPRAESAARLGQRLRSSGAAIPIDIIDDPLEALRHACAVSNRVVVAGSIFLIGPLRDILR
jgi:dihydrofolate synthase/folylpolyglutamate synthase